MNRYMSILLVLAMLFSYLPLTNNAQAQSMLRRDIASYYMPAADYGIVLSPSEPGQEYYEYDGNGIREGNIYKVNKTYYMFYDGAGAHEGECNCDNPFKHLWRGMLAKSDDLITWEKLGVRLWTGYDTDPNSSASVYKDYYSASSPWCYFSEEENIWYMFYLGAEGAAPSGINIGTPSTYYSTLVAKAKTPGLLGIEGEWQQLNRLPGQEKAVALWFGKGGATCSPGSVIQNPKWTPGDTVNKRYFMFTTRGDTIQLAASNSLDGIHNYDEPADPEGWNLYKHILDTSGKTAPENATIYFDESSGWYFLFTNQFSLDFTHTDCNIVYWTKDVENWDPRRCATITDTSTTKSTCATIGMPTVVKVDEKTLAIVYDVGPDTNHLHRSIALAYWEIPNLDENGFPLGYTEDTYISTLGEGNSIHMNFDNNTVLDGNWELLPADQPDNYFIDNKFVKSHTDYWVSFHTKAELGENTKVTAYIQVLDHPDAPHTRTFIGVRTTGGAVVTLDANGLWFGLSKNNELVVSLNGLAHIPGNAIIIPCAVDFTTSKKVELIDENDLISLYYCPDIGEKQFLAAIDISSPLVKVLDSNNQLVFEKEQAVNEKGPISFLAFGSSGEIDTITIEYPADILIEASTYTKAPGAKISINAQGTSSDYEYTIDNGANWYEENIFNFLNEGNYIVIVRLKKQPNVVSEPVEVRITQPKQLAFSIEKVDNKISIFAHGGTGSYEYSINNGVTWQNESIFDSLAGGVYQLMVKDRFNAYNYASQSITIDSKLPDYRGSQIRKTLVPYKNSNGEIETDNSRQGLRFCFDEVLDTNTYFHEGIEYTFKAFGGLVILKSNLSDYSLMTLDNLNTLQGLVKQSSLIDVHLDGNTYKSIYIYNIPENAKDTLICARTYIQCEDSDGNILYFYSEIQEKSITDVYYSIVEQGDYSTLDDGVHSWWD